MIAGCFDISHVVLKKTGVAEYELKWRVRSVDKVLRCRGGVRNSVQNLF